MTITEETLKKIIQLHDKITKASASKEEATEFWYEVNSYLVKDMAEELLDLRRHKEWTRKVISDMKEEVLAARTMRDRMDDYFIADDLLSDETFAVYSDAYDTIRAKNEGK